MSTTEKTKTFDFSFTLLAIGTPLLVIGLVLFVVLGPGKQSIEIEKGLKMLSASLPIDAGEELTMVAAEKDGSTVRFVYALKDENDPELAGYYQGMTNAEEAVEVCSTPNLALFLQWGTRLEFVYLSSENDEIVRTIVRQKDCAMIESGGA